MKNPNNNNSTDSFFKALSSLYNNSYTKEFFTPFKKKVLTPTKNAINMIFSNDELVTKNKYTEDIAKEQAKTSAVRRKNNALSIDNTVLRAENKICDAGKTELHTKIDKLTTEKAVLTTEKAVLITEKAELNTKLEAATSKLEVVDSVVKEADSAIKESSIVIEKQAQQIEAFKEKAEVLKEIIQKEEKQKLEDARLEIIKQEKIRAEKLAQKEAEVETNKIAKALRADHEKLKSDQAARETNQKLQEQQKIKFEEQQKIKFEKERLKNRTNSERVNDYIKKIYNHSLEFKKNNPFIITKTIFGIFILKLIVLNRAKILKLIEDRQKIWKYKAMAYLELATLSIISVLSITVLFNNSASVLKYVDGPSLKVILSGLKSSFDLYVNEKIESRIIKSTFLLISKSLFLGIPFSSEVAMTLLRYAALDYIVDNKISKNFRLDNLSIVKLTMRDF